MSFTKLRYHIVCATRRRRRVLTPELEGTLFQAMREKARELGGHIEELGGDDDHVHWLVDIPATIAVCDFVGQVKGYAAFVFNKIHPRARFAWQRGFGAFTVSIFEARELVAYIRNQREHHRRGNVVDAYELSEGFSPRTRASPPTRSPYPRHRSHRGATSLGCPWARSR